MVGLNEAQRLVVAVRTDVAECGERRKLKVAAHVGVHGPIRINVVAERHARRKLVKRVAGAFVEVKHVGAQAKGQLHAAFGKGSDSVGKERTTVVHVFGIVVKDKSAREALVKRRSVVLQLLGAKSDEAFPVLGLPGLLHAELVGNFLATVVQEQVGAAVVVEVLLGFVVEHKPAQHYVGGAKASKVGVLGSDGIVPLVVGRQVVQNVALVLGFIALEVELAHVVGTQAQEGDLVFAVELVLDFDLVVVVGG